MFHQMEAEEVEENAATESSKTNLVQWYHAQAKFPQKVAPSLG